MNTYAEEEAKLTLPQKMLKLGFTFQNESLITPLLFFYLQLGLIVTKKHRFDK